MKIHNIVRFVVAVLVCEMAGIAGALFTARSIPEWYTMLEKPALAPPNWIFAPVWTVLYLLMGIAVALVWCKGIEHQKVRVAVGVFAGQLALNVLWTMTFFGLRSPGGALGVIIALWTAIAVSIGMFWRLSREAAMLLMPYIVWVSFALYLNYAVWVLN